MAKTASEKARTDKVDDEPRDRQVPKLLLSYEEAAWSMGVSLSKVQKMVSRGQIPVVKLGGNSLIRPGDIQQLAEQHVEVRNPAA